MVLFLHVKKSIFPIKYFTENFNSTITQDSISLAEIIS